MRTRTYPKDVRALPLLEELQAAGVPVLAVRPPVAPGEPTTIDLDDSADGATVDAVLAAHDATALDAAAAQARADDDNNRAAVRQAVQQLLADAATLEAPGTLTVAQVRVLVARTDRALAATLKYLVRRGL